MAYLGDFKLGDTFDTKFCTVNTSGVPTTLAGTPVISAYPGNSTTELTAGITLTVDFDARTGMHNVRVVATTGNGYAAATNYQLVITTGTVGGSSVIGYVVGEFSIENRVQNIASIPILSGAYPQLGIIESGTAAAISGSTLTLKGSGAAFGTNVLAGATVWAFGATQGYFQERQVNSNTSGTSGVLTVDPWSVTPSGTVTYIIFGTAPISSTASVSTNITAIASSGPAATSLKNMLTAVGGETLTATLNSNLLGSAASFGATGVSQILAQVIAGLIAQGYTSSRATYLDNLNAPLDADVVSVAGVPVQQNGSGTQNMGGP